MGQLQYDPAAKQQPERSQAETARCRSNPTPRPISRAKLTPTLHMPRPATRGSTEAPWLQRDVALHGWRRVGRRVWTVFPAPALMENHGPIVQGDLPQARGHAERKAAPDMIRRHSPGSTRRLIKDMTPPILSLNCDTPPRPACRAKSRCPAIDRRTSQHDGCALSTRRRKRIKEASGRPKLSAAGSRPFIFGVERVRSRFILTMAPGNPARLPRLLQA